VGFSQAGRHGKLTLSLPARVLDLMPVSAEANLKSDWARELANQLIGRIKNRLLHFDVRLQVGVSALVDSQRRARELESSVDLRVYAGRTLHGEVLVTLEGLPEESKLIYVGQPNARSEGDAILF
jgi:chemotaxis protein CheX